MIYLLDFVLHQMFLLFFFLKKRQIIIQYYCYVDSLNNKWCYSLFLSMDAAL